MTEKRTRKGEEGGGEVRLTKGKFSIPKSKAKGRITKGYGGVAAANADSSNARSTKLHL